MATIDFFTFNHKNSYEYIEFQRDISEKLMSHKHKINWKCIESIEATKIPRGFNQVYTTCDAGHNSLSHSIAVNKAVELAEEKYVILIDCDVAILCKDWDDIVIKELDGKNPCFGGAYHDSSPRYKDFPCVYFFAYRNDIIGDIGLDFRPDVVIGIDSVNRIAISNKNDSYLFNRPIGFQIKCDTGWKLPLIIRAKGFNGSYMKCFYSQEGGLLPYKDHKQKVFCQKKPTHMAEWHYDGKLFGTHKQASRSHSLGSNWGMAWKERVLLYLKNQYGE